MSLRALQRLRISFRWRVFREKANGFLGIRRECISYGNWGIWDARTATRKEGHGNVCISRPMAGIGSRVSRVGQIGQISWIHRLVGFRPGFGVLIVSKGWMMI